MISKIIATLGIATALSAIVYLAISGKWDVAAYLMALASAEISLACYVAICDE